MNSPFVLKIFLWQMGCSKIKVEGVCWSFKQPNGNPWAGGIGAVRKYIMSDGYVQKLPRNPIRLSINHTPIWTDDNGG